MIAGAAGFIAGAILVTGGLVALAGRHWAAVDVAACLAGRLPPAVTALAWPMLYFVAFPAGVELMPFVMAAAAIAAGVQSRRVAGHAARLVGSRRVRAVRLGVFALQLAAIAGTRPAFLYAHHTLERHGVKVGWS